MPAAAARPPPHRGRRRPSPPRRLAPPDMAALRHRPGRGARARRRSCPPRAPRSAPAPRAAPPGGQAGARVGGRGPRRRGEGAGDRLHHRTRSGWGGFLLIVMWGGLWFCFLFERGCVFSPSPKFRFIFLLPLRGTYWFLDFPSSHSRPALGSRWGASSPHSGLWQPPRPGPPGAQRHASSVSS